EVTNNTTQAYITDDGTHKVLADGNVIVTAFQDLKFAVGVGAGAGAGGTAAGVADVTLITADDTEAYIGQDATVIGRGNRAAYAPYTGKKGPDGTALTEDVHGVSVTATSFADVFTFAIAGAGAGGAGGAGSGAVQVLSETVLAYVGRGARVN